MQNYSADTVKRDDSRETQTLGGPQGPPGPFQGDHAPLAASERNARVVWACGAVQERRQGTLENVWCLS